MSADLPDEVFLAVNPKGILIISPESKEVLASHPYNEVPTWGHSASSFVLHIGNLMRQTKIYFATEQGKEINELVRSYVNNIINQA
jgi:myosin-7